MNDTNKQEIRNKLSVFIDEISMVSSKLFYQIHKLLNEIFSPRTRCSIWRKIFFAFLDLCQLPPVRAKPVFIFNDNETMERFRCMDLWRKFTLAELDQVMHHYDEMFVKMLNKIRVVEISQSVEDVIKLRFIDKNDPCYPGNILHIFAENAPVKRHNDNHLKHVQDS